MNEEVSKYPLCWPEQWPRTAPHHRQVSRFEARSVAVAWNALLLEMRRLVGDGNWLMSSNIPRSKVSQAPLSNVATLADPGVAVYFKIKDKPVSLAGDKWIHVEDNIWALAKHIEALRGQERWGIGTIEQAFRGYMALPGIGESSGFKWWEVLGVPVNATADQVKAAYLRMVKEHHPDKNGDVEKFHLVRLAWQQFEAQIK